MEFPNVANISNPASSVASLADTKDPQVTGSHFASLVEGLLENVEQEQDQIGTEIQKVLTGETTNLHEVSLAVANADLSFRFMMQLRDQLIQTYREVIRMQV